MIIVDNNNDLMTMFAQAEAIMSEIKATPDQVNLSSILCSMLIGHLVASRGPDLMAGWLEMMIYCMEADAKGKAN